jgi:serine protease AprX
VADLRKGRRVRSLVALATTAVAGAPALAGAATVPVVHTVVSGWQSTTTTSSGTAMSDVVKAIGASSTGVDGTGVGVALVDTGVAPVPGLPSSHIVNGPDLSFESQGSTVRYLDTYGHGTHLAGIIMGNNSSASFKGVAPGVKLTSVKAGTAVGTVDVSQVIAAIDWVVQHRNDDSKNPIRVLNLSYGTPGAAPAWSDPLTFAVENAWKAGIVVVVAGGNGSNTANQLTDPGYDPFVLTVGSAATASTPSSTPTTLSSFTDTSSSRNVDIVAPGESIVSLRDPGSNIDTNYSGARVGSALFRGSGTSQAAAVVSGAVALLLAKRPTLTPDQAKALLIATAKPLTVGVGASQHLGVVNVAAAIAKSTPTTAQSWQSGFGTGSLNTSRGGVDVVHDGNPLIGEFDLFQPFSPAVWAQTTANRSAWTGGVWMGERLAGDGWTGSSWASKTWASATWAGTVWDGTGPWTDDTWSGHYWSSGAWTGHYWSGHYWSSDNWTTAYWG